MFEEENQITVEEVDRALSEIENKYSSIKSSPVSDSFEENLVVLSKEFDSIGIPSIDLNKPLSKVFKQVVSSARSLVQIHRKTVSEIKDVNITVQSKSSNNNYLYKVIEECNSKINSYEDKTGILKNKILFLENKVTEHKKKEIEIKNELDQVKRYCSSNSNEYARHVKKLLDENKKLRDSLGDDIDTSHSRDEVLLKYIRKNKCKEEIYKETIKKLQENNQKLLEEIMDLKTKGLRKHNK